MVNLSERTVPVAESPLSQYDVQQLSLARRSVSWSDVTATAHLLEGCETLFVTHWVRFVDNQAHELAVEQCRTLFEAAKAAGVQKVVFTSHTHATLASPYPYIAAKARAAELLRKSGLGYAIVRPCGIFGDTPEESILLNNASWVLRRVPLFLTAGDGSHRFQPIHVRDMAMLMFDLGTSLNTTGEEVDACGPDKPTALELFCGLRDAIGAVASVIPVRNFLSTKSITRLTQPVNWLTGDVLLDADELDLLCSGLTVAEYPNDPRISSRRSLFDWIDAQADHLGRRYISSIQRYYYRRNDP